ncbi:FabD/lysophospholipase-like protein [Nemania sp. FL0031]|nr:FabD/lysophospholipase-like protein [Nemania sp. FL0031]
MLEPNTSQTRDDDPWAPIVLSLDGGGVRGLSSLYILREIMREIKRLDDDAPAGDRLEQLNEELPLPCHYFDFMIGTSTGGLIAIMLGRLRMGVLDCIQQYWILSNAIFRPRRLRFVQLYSRRHVQEAAKKVVKQFCDRHLGSPGDCKGHEHLRQYDYEEEDSTSPNRNKTCRVAVLTVRDGGTTTFVNKRGDKPILFRSYNHRMRNPDDKWEHPKTLEGSDLMIHEACSAASAAPTYFRPVWLRGRKFIDGGVQANNPSMLAWNEAIYMANPPYDQKPNGPEKLPYALISIGTGRHEKYDRFSLSSFIYFMVRSIVDTETAHQHASTLQRFSRYWRFDVEAESSRTDHKGLAEIRLSDCKKSHLRPWIARAADKIRQRKSASTNANPSSTINAAENAQSVHNILPENMNPTVRLQQIKIEDQGLQEDVRETHKGGFKPSKYTYETFNNVRERTIQYCYSEQEQGQNVGKLITECATALRDRSLKRRNLERTQLAGVRSWTSFRKNPNPNHDNGKSEAQTAAPSQAGSSY